MEPLVFVVSGWLVVSLDKHGNDIDAGQRFETREAARKRAYAILDKDEGRARTRVVVVSQLSPTSERILDMEMEDISEMSHSLCTELGQLLYAYPCRECRGCLYIHERSTVEKEGFLERYSQEGWVCSVCSEEEFD